jgi:DNA-binding CsgD family transcriptional regulator
MNLLERERPLANLERALQCAAGGDASVVFVVGEPGLGKTTLLTESCSRASRFHVMRAACSELEQSIPFGLLDRLLVDLAPGTSEPASSRWTGFAEPRLKRYARTVGWLRNAAPSPLLLAVDDLHWADPDSVDLLMLVCRRLTGLAVALVATTRPWPSGALDQARSLVHDGVASLERLQPLSPTASKELLEQRSGTTLSDGFAEGAHQACAGNPLLLSEVAEAKLAGEDLLGTSGAPLGERVFLPRFAGVGTRALDWARAASVLGTRFRPDLAGRLSGQAWPGASEEFEALCRAGLVRASAGGGAEFVHPLVRQALYEDLALPVRHGLHARALLALLEEGAPPAEAAPHALASEVKGDPQTVAVLVAAGRQALAAGASATAVEHLGAALRAAGGTAPPALRLELAEAYLLTGRVSSAGEVVWPLLDQEGLGRNERVAATRLQARVLLASGRYPEAKLRFEEASELAALSDPALAAQVLLDGAFVGHLFEGPLESRRTVRRALLLLEEAGPKAEVLRRTALNADAQLACFGGDPSSLDEIAAAAHAEMAQEHRCYGWSWDIVFAYFNLTKIFERFDECTSMAASLMEPAARQGATLTHQSLVLSYADTLWRLGKLEESAKALGEAAQLADLVPSVAPRIWVGLANVSYEEGKPAEGAKWAAQVEAALARTGEYPYLALWLSLFKCRSLLQAGRAQEAAQAADDSLATATRSGMLEPCLVPWHATAIAAHVAAGRLDKAARLVTFLDDICRPLPCHSPRAVAAAGRAIIAWRSGELGAAESAFQEALAHNSLVPMPLAEAETLLAYGRFLRCSGQTGRARGTLHRALVVLEPTGAGRLQALVREELAAAGGRRRRLRPAGELTDKEAQVAWLAAQGLTNAQIARLLFLSAKTVDNHLSHVYGKLGITSRRELMLGSGGNAGGQGEDQRWDEARTIADGS